MADFSSKQYSWCHLTIAFGGRIIEGVTEVEYTKKTDKSYLRGRGCDPHEILSSNNSYDGKLKLWQSEIEGMIRDSPDKDLLKARFDVIVAYAPNDGGQTVIDILESVEATEIKKLLAQGDTNMIVELPIMFLKLKNQQ